MSEEEEKPLLDAIETTLKDLPEILGRLTEEVRALREAIEKALEVWTKIG